MLLHLSLHIVFKCAKRLITDAFADLLPVTRLKTVEMLDILQRTFQHMDTGLRRALRLGNDEGELKKEIDKVFSSRMVRACQILAACCSWQGNLL